MAQRLLGFDAGLYSSALVKVSVACLSAACHADGVTVVLPPLRLTERDIESKIVVVSPFSQSDAYQHHGGGGRLVGITTVCQGCGMMVGLTVDNANRVREAFAGLRTAGLPLKWKAD